MTVPTLSELQRISSWWWVICRQTGCGHKTPVALAPYVIRWGSHVSSDRLRRAARCTHCGGQGAVLQMPSHIDTVVGSRPFPAPETQKARPSRS